MDERGPERSRLAAEERVRIEVDSDGVRWKKVYFGGGAHLSNWLAQSEELAGKENVRTERVDAPELTCFSQGGEALYRVWVREGALAGGGDDRDQD